MVRFGIAVVVICVGIGFFEAAPGGSAPRVPRVGNNPAAEKHYKEGLRHRDAAWVYEEKMSGTKTDKERDTYARFIQMTYERACLEFEQAVEADPDFYQAYSCLGYVSRKTGKMEAALIAYDRALSLSPTYAEAVEYRAEAYFLLGRLEEGQGAFDLLASLNKPYAARLLDFAQKWAESDAEEETGVAVLKWVGEKRESLGEVKTRIEKW
jgi:tetratricopeptide (TPR) repeat protein